MQNPSYREIEGAKSASKLRQIPVSKALLLEAEIAEVAPRRERA
jgi:hypothetical protein